MAGVVGLNFQAVIAFAQLRGADTPLLAAVLPSMESLLIQHRRSSE